MFGPERIETLIRELNEYVSEGREDMARYCAVDIYRWIYHSSGEHIYKPLTELSERAKTLYPRLSEDLRKFR